MVENYSVLYILVFYLARFFLLMAWGQFFDSGETFKGSKKETVMGTRQI